MRAEYRQSQSDGHHHELVKGDSLLNTSLHLSDGTLKVLSNRGHLAVFRSHHSFSFPRYQCIESSRSMDHNSSLAATPWCRRQIVPEPEVHHSTLWDFIATDILKGPATDSPSHHGQTGAVAGRVI